ncbi:MAG TPA: LuxR C-terminal-related transcriptional regulator [Solirubrobacterales bacterium]|nr:LuxR C-terminal-related transcriptional regulator [Solirubrobacterales bacterium]
MPQATTPQSTTEGEPAAPAERQAPAFDPAFVLRPRLTERLLGSSADLVLLVAPAGYSKTTCLAEWAASDDRPFAWVAGTRRHHDPALLVSSIVDALDEIEVVDPGVMTALASPKPSISTVVVPRLQKALRNRSEPCVLVIDDVHAITGADSFAVIDSVIAAMPPGSQVALASRNEPPLPLGRLRAGRQLLELARRDLAMTRTESGELLARIGLELTNAQTDSLFERTEGWPAALYLAGLTLLEQTDVRAAIASFAGDDRVVVDYLRDEFLSATSAAEVDFLTQTAVLDELSGPLCDALLERSGSAHVLNRLSRSNFLVIPLDRRDDRYRYHHLFGEMLRSELHRSDPSSEAELHARASSWYAEEGDWDRAIDHAIAAADVQRAGELIWQTLPDVLGRGRIATMRRWLDELGPDRIAESGTLALAAAHCAIVDGDGDRTADWMRIADAAPGHSAARKSFRADVHLLRATCALDGVQRMGEDAERASELYPEEAPWQTACHLYRGVSSHLSGDPVRAVPLLGEAARRGAIVVPVIQTLALSQLGLIAMEDEDWEAASRAITQAREQVHRCGLSDYPSILMVYAASALVRAHQGQVALAETDIADTRRLLGLLHGFPPWYEAQARIVLARACTRLDDVAVGSAELDQAARFLEKTPDATVLNGWLRESRSALRAASSEGRREEWSLTTAELRTLQYLPSHLSFREIAERIHVSPNTVKTQAQAIYRKLEASSRNEAVERGRHAGLLADDPLIEASDP